MFGLGPMEMMIIGIVAVLLFGKRLPEVGRSLGKGLVEFKKGLNGIQDEIVNPGSTPAKPSGYRSQDDYEEPTAPRFEPPVADFSKEHGFEPPVGSPKPFEEPAGSK